MELYTVPHTVPGSLAVFPPFSFFFLFFVGGEGGDGVCGDYEKIKVCLLRMSPY